MKKQVMGVLMAAAMVVSLVGCGGKKTSDNGTDTYNAAVTAEEYAATIKTNADIYKEYVKLPSYKGIEVSVDRSGLEVSEEDIDSYLENLLKNSADTETLTSGTTVSGDTITLDYSGLLDGEAFSGGTATDTTYTIGSKKFIEDLDNGLVGLEVGQEYDIPCRFPDSYSNSDMAGKEVVFVVTVSQIERKHVPELTDEWVAENAEKLGSEATTVEALRKVVEDYLKSNAEATFASEKFELVWNNISEGVTVSGYPQAELDSLMNTLKTNIQTEYEQYGSAYGATDFYDYLSQVYNCADEEAYNKYALENAQQYLLEKMVLTMIAAENEITVSADDINEMGGQLASYYGYTDYQEILDNYGNEMNSEVGYEVLYQKVQEFLNTEAVEV